MNRWLPSYIIAIILIVVGLTVAVSAFLPRHISESFTMPSGQEGSPYLSLYLYEGYSIRIEYEEGDGTGVGVWLIDSDQFKLLQARGYFRENVCHSTGPSGKFGCNIEESDTYYIMVSHDSDIDQSISMNVDIYGLDVYVAAVGFTSLVGGGILAIAGSKFKKEDTYPWSEADHESDENKSYRE